jgi:hypothetical protein
MFFKAFIYTSRLLGCVKMTGGLGKSSLEDPNDRRHAGSSCSSYREDAAPTRVHETLYCPGLERSGTLLR